MSEDGPTGGFRQEGEFFPLQDAPTPFGFTGRVLLGMRIWMSVIEALRN